MLIWVWYTRPMRSIARHWRMMSSVFPRQMSLHFEMEAATVLTLGSLLSLPTACVFSIDGWVANVAKGNTVPDAAARDRGIVTAIDVALDALLRFSDA